MEKQYKYCFEALLCDKRFNRFMKGFDPTISAIGEKVKIYTTTTEPTEEYAEKMAHYMESMPDEEFCFTNVNFLGAEEWFGE